MLKITHLGIDQLGNALFVMTNHRLHDAACSCMNFAQLHGPNMASKAFIYSGFALYCSWKTAEHHLRMRLLVNDMVY